ncbi:MAG: hypothetical protein M3N98_04195, partial [Actinomycetota bacterium]|nr:hypothetical protein [Actinomycetota bacterium]
GGASVAGRDIGAAVALVRAARPADAGRGEGLSGEQQRLDRHFADLAGYHPCFTPPDPIGPMTPSSVEILERRRTRLKRLTPLLRGSSDLRGRLDRIPSSVRRGAERVGTALRRPKPKR